MNLWKKEEKTQTFDSLRVEHARRHRSYFHCHAKVRAYARCGAIRQSVGHNRADSRHGTKYANSTDVGNGPAKTINATDCMCSYIDGSIKISARTRVEFGGETERQKGRKKDETPRGASGSVISRRTTIPYAFYADSSPTEFARDSSSSIFQQYFLLFQYTIWRF